MKDYLSVGELARIFGLDAQTLHYYDSIGLYRPEIRDTKTRYRKYRFDQIYQLASIRYLRKMGYSLENIREFLDSRSPDDTLEMLNKRSEELQRQWAQLMRIDTAIRRKIQFVSQKRQNLNLSAVEARWFPNRYYMPIGGEEILYLEDSFYFYPTIAFYEGDLKYFGAYLYEPADDPDAESTAVHPPRTEVIVQGRYLVGYHKGPYETIQRTIKHMRQTHCDLQLGERVINFNIIDQFLERDRENYITEIQIPIEETQA